jgi:hypothetical protein
MLAMFGASADRCWGGPATAYAQGGSFWFAPTTTRTGGYSSASYNDALGAYITWFDYPSTVDTTPYAGSSSSEFKFTLAQLTAPGGAHTFTGFSLTGSGIYGSWNSSSGTGKSSTTYTGPTFTSATASWTVTATGGLGALPPGPPSYNAYCEGTDPWPISAADFSGFSGSQYNLWIPFEMTGGSSAGTGPGFSSSFGFGVNYTTASGIESLLQVGISGSQVNLTVGNDPHLTLYAISPSELGGAPDFSTPITTAQLQAALQSGAFPVDLGLSLTDIPIPTGDLGNGTVALVSDDDWASDAAVGVVPEPTSFALLGTGALSVLTYTWRRRAAKA